MDDLKLGLTVAAGIAAITGAILAVCWVFALFVMHADCHAKADAIGLEVSFGPMSGCHVKYEGQWVPLESLRFGDTQN